MSRPLAFNRPSRRSMVKRAALKPGPSRAIKKLAKKFMAYRKARQAEDESVDAFFERGASTGRFSYFDEWPKGTTKW